MGGLWMENANVYLMDSVAENYYKGVKKALENGADANYQCSHLRLTPLMTIVQDNVNIAKILVEYGAKIEEFSFFGFTPLIANAAIGNIKVVNFLLKKGCCPNDTNKSGQTALHLACTNGYTNVTKSLVKHGASINIRNTNGETPLIVALTKNHPDDAIFLIKNGANTNLCDDFGLGVDVFIQNIQDISKRMKLTRLL